MDDHKINMENTTLRDGFLGQRSIILPDNVKKVLKKSNVTKSFFITNIGFYPKANHHLRMRTEGAKQYIFIYCTAGEGWLKINKRRIIVSPNHFIIIPKKTPHTYGSNERKPWSIYWMHFDGAAAADLFARYNVKGARAMPVPYESVIIKKFDQIYTILKNNYLETQLELANILGLSFLATFIYHDYETVTSEIGDGKIVNRIIAFLEDNVEKPLKSQEITSRFNYSQSYIFGLFKKRTGYSLIHFFNLKKVQRACEYLKYSDFNIKEISFRVGFQDPLYFSRLFKKHMGVSPKVYRNQLEN